jgi:hypothetical protein
MRVRLSGFVMATLVVGSTALSAAERPPQDLHQVGDHWTAWNPPTPPEGAQVHVIVRGDTLWDLAARFYGDPYLWPQLWERNQYILDAHWIYPGDPLLLGPEVTPGPIAEVDPGTDDPVISEPEIPNVLTPEQAAGAPVPLGFESDIECHGYVGELAEQFPYEIVGSELDALRLDRGVDFGAGSDPTIQGRYGAASTVKFGLTTGDIVYVDGGRSRGLAPGLVFTSVIAGNAVHDPASREPIGRYYRYLGRVRVLSVQETTAIAEVVHTCDPILVGSHLKPFEAEPVPLGRPTGMRPVNFPAAEEKLRTAPRIVYVKDELIALGEDHVVHINVGGEQDATPGDIYTIYRENQPGLPPVVLGELAVLSVHPRFSVAKIIESRYTIHVGDRLDPK